METEEIVLKRFKKEITDIITVHGDITRDYIILRDIKNKEAIVKYLNGKNAFKNTYFISCESILESPSLFDMISKGISAKRKKQVWSLSDTKPFILISYDLIGLTHSKKTLFGYALKGRGKNKGLLGELKGEIIGRNSILVPKESLAQIEDFLKYWKLEYSSKTVIRGVNRT